MSSPIKYNVYIFLFPESNISTRCTFLSGTILHCNCLTLKAAVVAVAIWLSFMTLLRELDAVAARCVVIAEQFFSTASVLAVYIGSHLNLTNLFL